MRQDVFDNLVAVQDKLGDNMAPEAKRFLERLIKFGRRNGEAVMIKMTSWHGNVSILSLLLAWISCKLKVEIPVILDTMIHYVT